MKQLILLFFACSMLSVANAQYGRKGDFETKFYIKAGYSIPGWGSYDMEKKDWEDLNDYYETDVKRRGGTFQIGSLFMLNSIELASDMCLGINADYLTLTYNQFRWDYDEGSYYLSGQGYVTSNIGPMYTYSPADNFFIDVYAKSNIAWGTLSFDVFKYPEINNQGEETGDYDMSDMEYIDIIGLRYSVGLNIRYSAFIAGFEFTGGKHKLEDIDNEGSIVQTPDGSDKVPITALNFFLGVNF